MPRNGSSLTCERDECKIALHCFKSGVCCRGRGILCQNSPVCCPEEKPAG